MFPYRSSIAVAQWINWGGVGSKAAKKGKENQKTKDKGSGKSKDEGGLVPSATVGEESQGKSRGKEWCWWPGEGGRKTWS